MTESQPSRLHSLLQRVSDLFRRGDDDLSALAQATTAAIIVTDQSGKIAHISPGFTELTGFVAGDIVGQTPAMALHGQHTDHQTVEILRARCQAGEPFGVNILLYAKNNRPIWVTSQGRPVIRGGKLRGYLITQTAISQRATEGRVVNPIRANAA